MHLRTFYYKKRERWADGEKQAGCVQLTSSVYQWESSWLGREEVVSEQR
jgi:hypothetical protein